MTQSSGNINEPADEPAHKMKSAALRISIALNLILAAAVFCLCRRVPAAKMLPAPPVSAPVAAVVQPAPIALARPVSAPGSPSWLPWLQQLRGAGVPDEVVAGLVASDFQNRWGKKMSDVWRRYEAGELNDDERAQLEAQHDEQEEKDLRTALGDDGFERWDKTRVLADLDAAGVELSSSEADALYHLRKDLARRNHDLEQARRDGKIDPADFIAQQSAARQDYEKQFQALLGQDRYAALRSPDEKDGALRRSLKQLGADDAQAQGMGAIESNWNLQRLALDRQAQEGRIQGADYETQIAAIDAARDLASQQLLGTNGFNRLQELQDIRYQNLKRYAANWQLSDDDVEYVYRLIESRQKAVDDYEQQAHAQQEQGQPVDWAKIRENVRQFSSQTDQALNDYLGSDRFTRLKQNGVLTVGD